MGVRPIGLVHCNPSLIGYIIKVTPYSGCAVFLHGIKPIPDPFLFRFGSRRRRFLAGSPFPFPCVLCLRPCALPLPARPLLEAVRCRTTTRPRASRRRISRPRKSRRRIPRPRELCRRHPVTRAPASQSRRQSRRPRLRPPPDSSHAAAHKPRRPCFDSIELHHSILAPPP
jgi:hypothetical protein